MPLVDLPTVISLSYEGPRAPHSDEPFRLGFPFPLGMLQETNQLRMAANDGTPVALQAQPLLRWPDNSLKWVLIDWIGYASNLEVMDEAIALKFTPPEANRPVRATSRPSGIVIDGPGGTFEFRPGARLREILDWQVELPGDTTSLDPIISTACILDAGPLRASARLHGHFGSSSPLRWIAEAHFFANQELQRWTLTLRNTRRARHPGGIWELGDSGSIYIQRSRVQASLAEPADELQCSTDPDAPWTSSTRIMLDQASSGGQRWNSANHMDKDRQVRLAFRGYRFKTDDLETHSQRATPIATAYRHGQPLLSGYIEQFWQNFPKQLHASTSAIRLDLFPNNGTLTELQGGEQKTHTIWIGRSASASVTKMERLRENVFPRFPPEWLSQSNCIPFAAPLSAQEDRDYRILVDQAVDGPSSLFAKREQIDEYGWRHFGEVYGDHEAAFSPPEPPLISHWNNQYDLIFGLSVRYLRGGDARWLELMRDMARHVADIDIYHTDEDKSAYNHGLFWHTVHYQDAGTATHRSYPRGSVGGGPCAEHSYARGLLLAYFLTGETIFRDSVSELAEWIFTLEDGSRTRFRWFSTAHTGLSSASGDPDYHGPGRGPGNATETLLTAFELTGDRKFIDRVEELMYRVVHPLDNLDQLNLLDAERRWYYTLYLQALGRYLEIKAAIHELDVAYAYGRSVLLHYAGWMAENEYPYLDKPEILEYPTETWVAQDMRKSEVFHFAARHAPPEEQAVFRERAEYFYRYSVTTLARMKTSHFCRPLALLLGCGFTFDGFRESTAAAPQPISADTHWPRSRHFDPQKKRALRRIKTAFALIAGLSATALAIRLSILILA